MISLEYITKYEFGQLKTWVGTSQDTLDEVFERSRQDWEKFRKDFHRFYGSPSSAGVPYYPRLKIHKITFPGSFEWPYGSAIHDVPITQKLILDDKNVRLVFEGFIETINPRTVIKGMLGSNSEDYMDLTFLIENTIGDTYKHTHIRFMGNYFSWNHNEGEPWVLGR